MQDAQLLPQRCKNVALRTVQERMDAGYGIYAGATPQWALLLFNPQAAQWASCEEWHPQAQGQCVPTAATKCACRTWTPPNC